MNPTVIAMAVGMAIIAFLLGLIQASNQWPRFNMTLGIMAALAIGVLSVLIYTTPDVMSGSAIKDIGLYVGLPIVVPGILGGLIGMFIKKRRRDKDSEYMNFDPLEGLGDFGEDAKDRSL